MANMSQLSSLAHVPWKLCLHWTYESHTAFERSSDDRHPLNCIHTTHNSTCIYPRCLQKSSEQTRTQLNMNQLKYFKSPITLSKTIKLEQYQVNAQLVIVLINPKKFHKNPSKGFEEFVWTKFSMAIFQSPITPLKISNQNGIKLMHIQAWYLSILQSFIKIRQGLERNCERTNI